jgi:hypothetical protein
MGLRASAFGLRFGTLALGPMSVWPQRPSGAEALDHHRALIAALEALRHPKAGHDGNQNTMATKI